MMMVFAYQMSIITLDNKTCKDLSSPPKSSIIEAIIMNEGASSDVKVICQRNMD